ncbi:fusaric acid resistance protein [Acetobacter nitrogenifigens DSM 23921 = NBRC 105050]|uniref:Fusaric acid resistance protein n=2 Tax=Acetobacter nitrogenifigens TaxID=285268 RepID=A0A511X7V6_9PROT|nr:fusaric acid resistance protein [Acetobacter nitrogenifigens DSM 23921 = NBRC 105050]GEN59011.1 fusaric acid resistance protein [Acetobacter nitrogenifigens DSM 23921 = NBRC 105050]
MGPYADVTPRGQFVLPTGPSTRRLWRLICNPAPGRMGYALRMAAGCTTTVLIGEIWQIPELAVPTLVTMALWQEDRTTNAIAGVGVNLLILVLLALVYGIIRITLDHPLGIVIAVALLSCGFFFLGSASKLKPVAYMLGLIVVYAMIAVDQVPVGELATRALLYADLFTLAPGVVMVVLGLLICPSPKALLTRRIAARLRMSAALLAAPDPLLLERADDMMREGMSGMAKNVKMARLEKIWRANDLAALEQAARSSVALLILARAHASRSDDDGSLKDLAPTMQEMAIIFEGGDYPIDIPSPTRIGQTSHDAMVDILSSFTNPAPSHSPAPQPEGNGFFFADAFTNPEHVRFAVKGTAAVMFSYFVFKILNWQGIHTSIITCFIVAQPTMGEMISKLSLRISGALVGATLGILSIVFVMPHLHNVVAFLLLIFIGSLIGAWVKTGDARIAYAGFQIGLAFFLSDLKDYGPTTDMTTARDRIVGIMLGNLITYAMFTSFWPSSAYQKIPKRLDAMFAALRRQIAARTEPDRMLCAADAQTALSAAERVFENATVEPAHMRAQMDRLAQYHDILSKAAELTADTLLSPASPDLTTRLVALEAHTP